MLSIHLPSINNPREDLFPAIIDEDLTGINLGASADSFVEHLKKAILEVYDDAKIKVDGLDLVVHDLLDPDSSLEIRARADIEEITELLRLDSDRWVVLLPYTQEDLADVWQCAKSPILEVFSWVEDSTTGEEELVNMGFAQVRQICGQYWLYQDNADGYRWLSEGTVEWWDQQGQLFEAVPA